MDIKILVPFTAAVLALSTGGWVRNGFLVMGVGSGAIAIYRLSPLQKSRQREAQVLELAIESALKQVEQDISDRTSSLQKLIADKNRELAEIDQLTSAEVKQIHQEKQQHIANLNHQIEELSQLLEEQLAEIDQREEQSRQRLTLEIDQYKASVEAGLLVKQQQLNAIAADDEAWLQQETEKLTAQLEEDKRKFLSVHQAECDRLLDEIDRLESELNAAYQLLEKYEEPELPRGFDVEKVVAYKLQMFWKAKGITTHLIGVYPDEGNRRVLVRLRPKTGGQKQFKKEWLNELQIQEDLPEPVNIQTVAGAIEFEIKPRTWTAFKPWDDSSPPPEQQTPGYHFENQTPVTKEELQNFHQPMFRIDPKGAIGRLEQTWVISLWESGVRTQGTLLPTVYRSSTGNPVSKGDGSSFINARARMYSILDAQQIQYSRRTA